MLDASENWNETNLEFRHVPPGIQDFKGKHNILTFANVTSERKRADKSFITYNVTGTL